MPKSTTLKLNGKPFDPHPPRPTVVKLVKYLDSRPHDEIYTVDQLAKDAGSGPAHTRGVLASPAMERYTTIVGNRRFVGHPEAIAELKRQTGAR